MRSPGAVRCGEFAKVLGKAVGRPAVLGVPGWVLRMAMGEGAGVLLDSQQVVPKRLMEDGYVFRWPKLGEVLAECVKKC